MSGVRIEGAVVATHAVVLAMGPWTREAAAWAGHQIPVAPLKGQILRLRVPGAASGVRVSDAAGDYAVPKPDGLVYAGTTEERAGFDEQATSSARDEILRKLARFSFTLARGDPVDQTACLRPLSADGLPILGAVPALPGAYVATGHGRSGIPLSSGSGKALAELIAQGRCESLDLTRFDPARFEKRL